MGKETRDRLRGKVDPSNGVLYLVHIDLCGPSRTRSCHGNKYF